MNNFVEIVFQSNLPTNIASSFHISLTVFTDVFQYLIFKIQFATNVGTLNSHCDTHVDDMYETKGTRNIVPFRKTYHLRLIKNEMISFIQLYPQTKDSPLLQTYFVQESHSMAISLMLIMVMMSSRRKMADIKTSVQLDDLRIEALKYFSCTCCLSEDFLLYITCHDTIESIFFYCPCIRSYFKCLLNMK